MLYMKAVVGNESKPDLQEHHVEGLTTLHVATPKRSGCEQSQLKGRNKVVSNAITTSIICKCGKSS